MVIKHQGSDSQEGSVIGPVIFIVYVARLFDYCLKDLKHSAMVGYCDDNTGILGAKTASELSDNAEIFIARLSAFSARREIILNADKTQLLCSSSAIDVLNVGEMSLSPKKNLDLLGTIFESNGRFALNNESVAKDLSCRVGAVRRVLPHVSRGPLLREIGLALVIGKANYAAWITREARTRDQSSISSQQHIGQVAINDLARVLTGKSRKDRVRIIDLMNKARIPTYNEIIVKRASFEAWKAFNGGVLSSQLISSAESTRNAINNIVRPKTQSIADKNLANCWNASPELRSAQNKSSAKKAAAKLASEFRFL